MTGIADGFVFGGPIGVGTRVGTMMIGQRRARDHLKWGQIKGRHFFHLSIHTNDRHLKQISKTIVPKYNVSVIGILLIIDSSLVDASRLSTTDNEGSIWHTWHTHNTLSCFDR